ncbi:hypothetical protein [Dyella caseinilytica]|uniref:Uncharacterized protein n=1 Tax=Dyella caseinilytica TaxID=1849581 RepID=A0ABX7GXJ0_9GAMM|nr:hypothetical protein [Dyella caseinilytica]QRN55210.1 hypothetical protein ISN74_07740 [Dyella caseinilytica]GGA00145.1 hypothetical protein GCM10011408_21230 [Dyella caseinilytica]
MSVIRIDRPIYYSERRKRHFITARGAAMAEANARMYQWFPSEKAEYEDGYGRCTYPGFHFTSDPRLVAMRNRLFNRYMKQLKAKTNSTHVSDEVRDER